MARYQLMIVIPSDFSEKVLEVNAVNAEKTTWELPESNAAAEILKLKMRQLKVAKDINFRLEPCSQLVICIYGQHFKQCLYSSKNVGNKQ